MLKIKHLAKVYQAHQHLQVTKKVELYNLFHLMSATARAHASTPATSLMRLKNCTSHFYL